MKFIKDDFILENECAKKLFEFAKDLPIIDYHCHHGKNQKGLVTMDRKLKKDAFYLYKSYWNKEDEFVHICSRRYVNRHEDITTVKVYPNLDEVSLYVDDELFDIKKGNNIFIFDVPINGKHHFKTVLKH